MNQVGPPEHVIVRHRPLGHSRREEALMLPSTADLLSLLGSAAARRRRGGFLQAYPARALVMGVGRQRSADA